MKHWFKKIRIGFLHAKYHRNLRRAEGARMCANLVAFQKYIYRAEDAWRKIVILSQE